MFDKFFKKEKPIQGITGMGGDYASRIFGGGSVFEIRVRSLIQVMDTSITCLKDLESTP